MRDIPSYSSNSDTPPSIPKESSNDVVVMLDGNRLKKGISTSYKKITFDDGSTKFCLIDEENISKCINYGDLTKNDSNEYYVAYVNRKTKEISYKPASIVKLNPKIVENREKFFRGKVDKEIKFDFDKTVEMDRDDYVVKRNALTLDFGSIRKRKMLDDVVKRSVDHDTMVALADTAFASGTNIDEKPNLNQSGIEVLNSINGSSQGEVVPKYNPDGKKPLEIWPIEQFIEDTTYDMVSQQCIEFFQDKSFDDLIELGFPKLISELAHAHITDGKVDKRLYLIMKLHYMIILYANCRGNRRINLKNIQYNNIPEMLVTQINSEFFDTSKATRLGFIPYTTATTDKLASHILILYMLLNEPKHSIYINLASSQFHISEFQMSRYLTKLGCVINKPTNEEEINYGVTRVGVIKNTPGLKVFASKRKR